MGKNRLETGSPDIQISINTVLITLKDQPKTLLTDIDQQIDNDPDLEQRQNLLEIIPSIGNCFLLMIALCPNQNFAHRTQCAFCTR